MTHYWSKKDGTGEQVMDNWLKQEWEKRSPEGQKEWEQVWPGERYERYDDENLRIMFSIKREGVHHVEGMLSFVDVLSGISAVQPFKAQNIMHTVKKIKRTVGKYQCASDKSSAKNF